MTYPSKLSAFERLLGRIVLISHRFAMPVISAALIMSLGLTVYVANNISVRTDTDEMIDPELPFRQAYTQFQNEFPQISDTLVMVIRSPIPDAADAVRDELVAVLGKDKAHFTNVYAPGHGPFFSKNGLLFLKTQEIEALSDRLATAQPVLASMVEDPSLSQFFDLLGQGLDTAEDGDSVSAETLDIVFKALIPVFESNAEEPLSWNKMFDPDLAEEDEFLRFIVVQPTLDPSKLQPAKEALAVARQVAADVVADKQAYVSIDFTGKIALNAEELKSVSNGAALAGILSAILVALILGFGFRSWKLVLATLITLIAGLIWTAAFAIATIGYLNIISVAFAVLFIGLGIDFGVHFALRYGEQRAYGESSGDALVHTASTTGAALAVCAPTTALAFFAFVPTAYVGLSQLGIISGTGIIISLIGSLTLLPALLHVLPGRAALASTRSSGRISGFVTKHGLIISLLGIGLGLAAAFIAPQARFDADPIRLKDQETPSVQAYYRLTEDGDTSPYVVQILADGAEQAADITAKLKDHPSVHRVVEFNSFIPSDQDEKLFLIDNLALTLTPVLLGEVRKPDAVTPEDKEALLLFSDQLDAYEPKNETAARLNGAVRTYLDRLQENETQLAGLNSAVFTYWPQAMAALFDSMDAQPIDAEAVPDALRNRYISGNDKYRIEVYPAETITNENVLAQFVDDIRQITPNVTGSPVQITGAGEVVKGAMLEATGLAAVLVTLFLMLVLRDIRRVILVLVPIALAGLLTLAASVLLPLPFNFANVIVLPLLIGLGVDSGIHLVSRAHEGDGHALLTTSTPKAVFLSALTTLASFGTLAVSSHQGTATMGMLLFIAIFFTLLCTLIVLPAMIAVLERRNGN